MEQDRLSQIGAVLSQEEEERDSASSSAICEEEEGDIETLNEQQKQRCELYSQQQSSILQKRKAAAFSDNETPRKAPTPAERIEESEKSEADKLQSNQWKDENDINKYRANLIQQCLEQQEEFAQNPQLLVDLLIHPSVQSLPPLLLQQLLNLQQQQYQLQSDLLSLQMINYLYFRLTPEMTDSLVKYYDDMTVQSVIEVLTHDNKQRETKSG